MSVTGLGTVTDLKSVSSLMTLIVLIAATSSAALPVASITVRIAAGSTNGSSP